ncbi:MAG: hypothetical protein K8R86_11030, partial [Bacteroidales bacterium]|nr:hypothetical protein [Bacteroidales bacterium]
MKDSFKNIDELLKQSLEGYKKEPSVGVWKRISLRLLLIDRGIYFIIAAFIIAVVTGTFFYLNSNDTESEVNFHKEDISTIVSEEINLAKEKESSVKPIESNTSNQLTTNTGNEIKAKISKDNEMPGISDKSTVLSKNKEPDMILSSVAENNMETSGLTENKNIHYNVYPGLERLDKMDKTKPLKINALPGLYLANEYSSTIYPRASYMRTPSLLKDDYGHRGSWNYGVHITPELIFTNEKNNSNKMALNLDVTGIYNVNDWFIQFGAGVGLSEDNGTYRIDYAQYDSIGYYYEVTGFTIDPETGAPVYKTDIKDVYDTVLYNQTKTTDNLYTYLRFPVFGGLKVHENKRFSVCVKAGGTYSILINKNEPGTDFTNDKATWITISNETPERIQSN